MNLKDLSDEQLIQGIAEKDEQMTVEFYNRKVPMMTGYLRKWNKSDDEIMDLIHETFIRIIRFAHQYKPIASVNTWIFKILNSRMYNDYRKNKHYNSFLSLDIDPNEPNYKPIMPFTLDPDVHTAKVIREGIARRMKLMSAEYREVMILRHWYHMSYEEIAEELGINEGTVKSRINRGRKYMKDHLGHLLN